MSDISIPVIEEDCSQAALENMEACNKLMGILEKYIYNLSKLVMDETGKKIKVKDVETTLS